MQVASPVTSFVATSSPFRQVGSGSEFAYTAVALESQAPLNEIVNASPGLPSPSNTLPQAVAHPT